MLTNLDSPRQITETENGYVIVGSKKGDKIFAFMIAILMVMLKKELIADGLQNPTGVTFHNGDLYFAEIDTIWVVKNIDNWLNSKVQNIANKNNLYE